MTETTSVSRSAAAGAEAVADDEDAVGSKKRKREEGPDKSDTKLQEYLRVMRSGRESIVADETAPDFDSPLAPTGGVGVADGESDDEYVEVPSRREKQRKVDHPTESGQVESQASSTRDPSSRSNVPPARPDSMVAESTEPPQADETQPTVATEATDDDWLRSRTNRLLDLVDPDDLPGTAVGDQTGGPVGEVVGNDNDNLHSQGDGNDGVKNITPQEDSGKQDMGSSVDAISRTSRLFVRNLAYSATEDEIREAFDKFGDLQEVSFSARSLFRFYVMFVFYRFGNPKKHTPQKHPKYGCCMMNPR